MVERDVLQLPVFTATAHSAHVVKAPLLLAQKQTGLLPTQSPACVATQYVLHPDPSARSLYLFANLTKHASSPTAAPPTPPIVPAMGPSAQVSG